MASEEFTLGVEEEYQIIDPETRRLRPRVLPILHQAEAALGENVQPEFHASQIEIATPVCRSLAEARQQIVGSRRALIEAAGRAGGRIAAAATHPLTQSGAEPATPKPRYEDMADQYRALADELVIFGCHVHVGVGEREAALGVLNRTRPWLATLLALSASSPFWAGADTGYASYRTELWVRWPMAGPPLAFASLDDHDALIRALVATGSISDGTKIYWDVRLPERLPTIEFRIADVCPTVDEAVMLTGLIRALVQTCHADALADAPFPHVRPELLRAAHWRAARYGLEGELIDTVAEEAVPAADMVGRLLALTRPSLEASGDWPEVSALVQQQLARGSSAQRQRAVFARTGRLEDVVDSVLDETAQGVV